MSIKAFGDMLRGIGLTISGLGKALAAHLDVPYHEDRSVERLLGHRHRGIEREEAIEQGLLSSRQFRMPDGALMETNDFPPVNSGAVQLTEEVWTKDHWPDNYNDVPGALQRLPHGIVGLYYHKPSMNLVLLGPVGEKVGIRSTAISGFSADPKTHQRIEMLGRLKKAATS